MENKEEALVVFHGETGIRFCYETEKGDGIRSLKNVAHFNYIKQKGKEKKLFLINYYEFSSEKRNIDDWALKEVYFDEIIFNEEFRKTLMKSIKKILDEYNFDIANKPKFKKKLSEYYSQLAEID